jgi:hypothetical protein
MWWCDKATPPNPFNLEMTMIYPSFKMKHFNWSLLVKSSNPLHNKLRDIFVKAYLHGPLSQNGWQGSILWSPQDAHLELALLNLVSFLFNSFFLIILHSCLQIDVLDFNTQCVTLSSWIQPWMVFKHYLWRIYSYKNFMKTFLQRDCH